MSTTFVAPGRSFDLVILVCEKYKRVETTPKIIKIPPKNLEPLRLANENKSVTISSIGDKVPKNAPLKIKAAPLPTRIARGILPIWLFLLNNLNKSIKDRNNGINCNSSCWGFELNRGDISFGTMTSNHRSIKTYADETPMKK